MAYTIGPNALRHVCPSLSRPDAQILAMQLGRAMHEFGITSRRRAAAYIAQVAHESGEFKYSVEIWGPTAAQRGYEGRRDLGNIHSGDGFRFRGRGYIQTTGRTNYTEVSRALDVDFVKDPALLGTPKYAALSAAWWWKAHGCNQIADRRDFKGLTIRINGGLNGYSDRKKYWRRAILVSHWLVPRST